MSKYLDSRDLEERIEELEGLKQTLQNARYEREEIGASPASTQSEIDEANDAIQNAENDFGESEIEELQQLLDLRDQVGREWKHGVTLIPESDFVDYAQQLAEDLYGDAIRDASWPMCHIDWKAAADSLKMDYTSVEYQGASYLYRA